MPDIPRMKYVLKDTTELNLSHMPFINEGGLFIPTKDSFMLDDLVIVELFLPQKKDPLEIQGKVVWVTPKNALHHVITGIGIQFVGKEAKNVRKQIEDNLDPNLEVGGYTHGIIEKTKN